jgi:hypothetical protein
MLLRCRCLTKSLPCLVCVLFWCLAQNVWHPNNVPDLAPNSETSFGAPKSFVGSILGVHFRAPVLGSSFWVQFWDPVLDQIWDQKTSIVGPTFGTKSGSIFGVQILVSLILLIRAGFQVPVLGPKTDPVLEPKKSEKWTRSGTQMWDPI